jgi:hypothetical protein
LGGGDTEPAAEYTFFYGKGNENHELGTDFLCIRLISLVRRVEFISDIIHNTKRATGVISLFSTFMPQPNIKLMMRSASMRNQNVFDTFPKYHTNILLDWNLLVVP